VSTTNSFIRILSVCALASCSSNPGAGVRDGDVSDVPRDGSAADRDAGASDGKGMTDARDGGVAQPWSGRRPEIQGFTPYQIASLPGGEVFLGGTPTVIGEAGVTTIPSIAKLDSTGSLQRLTNVFPFMPKPAAAELDDVAADPGGVAAFTGRTTQPFPGETQHNSAGDVYVGKLAASGEVAWSHQLGSGAATTPDTAYAVAADGEGGVIAVGSASGTFPGESAVQGGFILKYDKDGTLLWHKQMKSVDDEQVLELYSVATDQTNNVYCAGFAFTTDGSTNSYHIYLVKLDALGNELWHTFSEADRLIGDRIYLAVSQGGDALYVAGTQDIPNPDGSQGFYASAAALLSFDGSGHVTRTTTLGSTNSKGKPGTDTVDAVVATADGLQVFVTGTSDGTFGGAVAASPQQGPGFIAGYDSTGSMLWVQRLPATGADLALGPGATVYVSTGYFDVKLWPMGWAIFKIDRATGAVR